MKLKELMGKIVENKKNKQLNINFKKNKLKKIGISHKELLDMDVDFKLKKLMFED